MAEEKKEKFKLKKIHYIIISVTLIVIFLITMIILLITHKPLSIEGITISTEVYTNIVGDGPIESSNHTYWNNRKGVIFYNQNYKKCVIANRVSETNQGSYIEEQYDGLYDISKKLCTDLEYVVGTKNKIYLFVGKEIVILNTKVDKNMDNNEVILNNKDEYEPYGVKDNSVYFKTSESAGVKLDIDIQRRSVVGLSELKMDAYPRELDFSEKNKQEN